MTLFSYRVEAGSRFLAESRGDLYATRALGSSGRRAAVVAAVIGVMSGSAALAADPIGISLANGTWSYGTDFNSLPTTTGTTFSLTGWYASQSTISGGTGSTTAGGLYSFGSSSAPGDRALGSLASDSVGGFFYGAQFQNNTGVILKGFAISYTGEQWRRANNAAVQSIAFSYGTGIATAENTAITFTNYDALNFNSPQIGATTATSLDGNTVANRAAVSSTLYTPVQAGDGFFIKFTDANDTGTDHSLAIDDFSITALVAQNLTWNVAGDGAWNKSAANFRLPAGTAAVYTDGDLATFNQSAGGTITVDAAGIITSGVTVSASAGTYTFAGGSISGGGGLVKSGAGTLTVAAPNAFTGGTTLAGGRLNINATGALGSGTITVTGGSIDNTSGSAVSVANRFTLNSNLTVAGTGDLTLSSAISGTGGLIKEGAGTLTLSSTSSSYSGGLNIRGGTVEAASVAGFGGGGGSASGLVGTLTLDGGTFRYNPSAASASVGSGYAISTATNGGTIDLPSGKTLTLAGQVAGNGKLTKTGAGTLVLTNATNANAGGVQIDGGVLSVANDANLGATSGAVTVNAGTLRFTDGTSLNAARTINLGAATSTLETAGNAVTVNGVVAGTGKLVKTGTAALNLVNTGNSFNGGVQISAGTLGVGTAGALGDTSNTITVGNAGILRFDSTGVTSPNRSVAAGRGVVLDGAGSTISVNGSESWTINGVVSGSGALNKNDTGTLVLANGSLASPNTFTGGVFLNSGTLSVNSVYALGTSTSSLPDAVTFNGGTLQYTNDGAGTASTSNRPFYVGANGGAINVSDAAGVLSINGRVTNATGATPGNLAVRGPGQLTLTGTVTNVPVVLGPTSGTGTSTLRITSASPSLASLASSSSGSGSIVLGSTGSTATMLTVGTNHASTAYAGTIADANTANGAIGHLVKAGDGTFALSGANTYSGTTRITGGRLLANTPAASGSATGSGAVSVEAGGMLAGTGRVAGSVTVNAGGVISAGSGAALPASTGGTTADNVAGKLTTGGQTWNAGGSYRVKMASSTGVAGVGYDTLAMGVLNLSSLSSDNRFGIVLLKTAAGTFNTGQSGQFLLASASTITRDGVHAVAANTDLSSLFELDTASLGIANTETRTYFSVTSGSSGGDLMLSFDAQGQAAPEPTTAALVGLGGIAVLGRRRRHTAR